MIALAPVHALAQTPPEDSVSVRERQSPGAVDRYALGVHHIAFGAGSRAVIDERAAWLRDNGHTIESGPEEYGYAPGYYAVFFYDPDGIKLEIVHRPREGDLVRRVAELEARVRELES